MGEVNYRIRIPWRGIRLYHVNMLKQWQEEEEAEDPDLGMYNTKIDWDIEGQERSQELHQQAAQGIPTSVWQ